MQVDSPLGHKPCACDITMALADLSMMRERDRPAALSRPGLGQFFPSRAARGVERRETSNQSPRLAGRGARLGVDAPALRRSAAAIFGSSGRAFVRTYPDRQPAPGRALVVVPGRSPEASRVSG